VLATLLVQGLTLGPLIAALKIKPDDEPERERQRARLQMTYAALAAVNQLAATGTLHEPAIAHVRSLYAMRLERLVGNTNDALGHLPDTIKLHRAALQAERRQMIELWRKGALGDEPRRVLERELDLEEARLAGELG